MKGCTQTLKKNPKLSPFPLLQFSKWHFLSKVSFSADTMKPLLSSRQSFSLESLRTWCHLLNYTNSMFISIINCSTLELPACLAVLGGQVPWAQHCHAYLEISPSPRASTSTIHHNRAHSTDPACFLTLNFPSCQQHPLFHLHKPVHNPFQWLF